MTSVDADELSTAVENLRNAKSELDAARAQLAAKIAEAARSGMRQTEIVRVTGYTREHVRRICRQAGITSGD